MRESTIRRFWRNWWWLVLIIIADIIFVYWWFGPRRERLREAALQAAAAEQAALREQAILEERQRRYEPIRVGFPTAQRNLLEIDNPDVYMATASGRIESAHFGSTRTRSTGGRLLPAFHMGIDIAPLQRDRRNRALDPIKAVADGRVGYANRVIGHSNYGLYVVLEHDTSMGPIYTLYAHLRSIEDGIRPGAAVRKGDVLGIMGNTPSSIIPVARSHLHFEVGVMQNRRFAAWASSEEIRNLHGRHHGWNLAGIQPLALYESTDPVQHFSMLSYLEALPAAFKLVVDAPRPVDYFLRYPLLWTGTGSPRGAMVLSVSEGGVVLQGRPATENEVSGQRLPYVLHVDEDVLGRNGLRIVVSRGNAWQMGSNGIRWLSILLH